MNLTAKYETSQDLFERMVGIQLGVSTVDVDGTQKICLTANAQGAKSCAVPVPIWLEQALNGLLSGFFGNITGTLVATKYTGGTTLSVLDDTGFEDGNPIAVANLDDLSDVAYGQVQSTAANDITLEAALGAPDTFYKNAFVLNLAGLLPMASGRGYNNLPGVVSQMERPPAPAFTVADGTGDAIAVTITDPEYDSATHFDIYVFKQATRPDRIEPNRQPDAADKTTTDIASAISVSTYGGGADYVPDGAGGNLATTNVVWVAVVAKNGTGQVDVKESDVRWETHTLD